MFGIGFQEVGIILVVALLVFGPKRLPELARTLGKGLAEFRRASSDLRESIQIDLDADQDREQREQERQRDEESTDSPRPDASVLPTNSEGEEPDPATLLDAEGGDAEPESSHEPDAVPVKDPKEAPGG